MSAARACVTFALSLLAACPAVQAEISRCPQPVGSIGFADRACPPGVRQRIATVTIRNGDWNAASVMDAERGLLQSDDARVGRERGRAVQTADAYRGQQGRSRYDSDETRSDTDRYVAPNRGWVAPPPPPPPPCEWTQEGCDRRPPSGNGFTRAPLKR
jgi:hypothetical protein